MQLTERRRQAAVLMALLTVPLIGTAQMKPIRGQEAPNACGLIYTRHYGPYDYRTERNRLIVVEEFHFKPEMEAGIRGVNSTVAGEITYTLKASPNHHRALVTLMKIVDRSNNEMLPGLEWPAECYFDRAIRFAYDDPVVRLLYAKYLHKRKQTENAKVQVMQAIRFANDNPFTHYNAGLVAFEIGEMELALQQAHLSLEVGFPRTDLVESLKKAGHWREPVTAAPPAASATLQ